MDQVVQGRSQDWQGGGVPKEGGLQVFSSGGNGAQYVFYFLIINTSKIFLFSIFIQLLLDD